MFSSLRLFITFLMKNMVIFLNSTFLKYLKIKSYLSPFLKSSQRIQIHLDDTCFILCKVKIRKTRLLRWYFVVSNAVKKLCQIKKWGKSSPLFPLINWLFYRMLVVFLYFSFPHTDQQSLSSRIERIFHKAQSVCSDNFIFFVAIQPSINTVLVD
jgi:hypothetical protein